MYWLDFGDQQHGEVLVQLSDAALASFLCMLELKLQDPKLQQAGRSGPYARIACCFVLIALRLLELLAEPLPRLEDEGQELFAVIEVLGCLDAVTHLLAEGPELGNEEHDDGVELPASFLCERLCEVGPEDLDCFSGEDPGEHDVDLVELGLDQLIGFEPGSGALIWQSIPWPLVAVDDGILGHAGAVGCTVGETRGL